jgi:hypothetical protein
MIKKRYLIATCVTLSLGLLIFGLSIQKTRTPFLTVIGFTDMSDGLGRQSVEIMDTMQSLVRVGYRATAKPLYEDVPLAVQKIMKTKYKKLGQVIVYEDIIHPTSHSFFQKRFDLKSPKQIRLAYTMFESSKIPMRWVHNLNLYFDALVVPDPFLIETYQSSGVTIPIFVVPLGLNLQDFLNSPLKTQSHTPFVFANFSTCIARKNHRGLIKAFHTAFGNDPRVLLWINSKYSKEYLFEEIQKEVDALGVSNIRLTNNCYNRAEYLQNFHQIDCYVSLSEAEGFSIQPREAMSLGIPCIISDNTGQSTICKSSLVSSVPCPIKELAYYEQFQEIFGTRYSVDFEQSVHAFKEMYLHYDRYLAQAKERRTWAKNYDYEALRPLYRSLIKPTTVFLGNTNQVTQEYLMTSSLALYQKYQVITCGKSS